MGSPDTDAEAYDDGKPSTQVTVSAFAISRYPITRELYRELYDTLPQAWERDSDDHRLPANDVNWFEAASFCNALSRQVGLQPCYRIDGTHVRWDTQIGFMAIACRLRPNGNTPARAGTTSRWFFGDDPAALDRYAWFAANAHNQVQPPESPESPGAYDMSGNVWGSGAGIGTIRIGLKQLLIRLVRRTVTAACCAGAPRGSSTRGSCGLRTGDRARARVPVRRHRLSLCAPPAPPALNFLSHWPLVLFCSRVARACRM